MKVRPAISRIDKRSRVLKTAECEEGKNWGESKEQVGGQYKTDDAKHQRW